MAQETILIVDDSQPVREFLDEGILRPAGYATLLAADGLAALDLARSAHPDLIVTDWQMPGLDGLSLVQQLQAENLCPPVILTTAEGSEELAVEALRAGVSDYLVKPFEADVLLASVSRALNHAGQERAGRGPSATARLLQSRLQELETLALVGRTATASLDLDQVLTTVVDAAVHLTHAEEGSLLLLDEKTGELTMRAARNFDDEFVRTFRLRSEDSLAGHVIRTGEPVLLDDAAPQKIKTAYLVHSLLYVPLKVHGRTIGVLGVDNRRAGRGLTSHHRKLMLAMADYAAIAIENARLYSRSESERTQLETILTQTGDGVLVVDFDDRLLLVNQTARSAFGLNGDRLDGQAVREAIPVPEIDRLLSAGQPGREELMRAEVPLEDGRVLNAHLSPIAGVGRAVVMQDITHLKELDRIKSEFVSTVSHDLRSPLTAILGYAELIGRAGPVTPQQSEFVRRIEFSVQSISALITDLLDLGRIEAGFDQHREAVSLAAVGNHVVETLRGQVEARGQKLVVDLPPDLPLVEGSLIRLRQMVSNLLDNAIKYTPDSGRVMFKARAEGDLVVLSVSDTGPGIPPGDLPYIFDKFFRSSSVSPDTPGTGLGLSIVKSIVENHGGRMWVDSKVGVGTSFTVVLPASR
ncbi:MAG: response regulator [Chloroflexi bacterium]|nr:response regulator [Chloroflexota bacterium]